MTDEASLAGLEERSIDEVRSMRADCQSLEAQLSYVRRLAQGRLDIVDAELARRREGRPPSDLAEMVAALPGTLGRHLTAPGSGKRPTTIEPVEPDAALVEPLDRVLDVDALGRLPAQSDDELAAIRQGLADVEADLSARRRVLFERLDALSAEITRRYRTGEASVESLLQ
ncbi:MAG TPA: hypothetical protein VMK16_04100 [Acidimicrobiales bacterium]|nr:hypothetical protein [Acidimicrobiales bacterium]